MSKSQENTTCSEMLGIFNKIKDGTYTKPIAPQLSESDTVSFKQHAIELNSMTHAYAGNKSAMLSNLQSSLDDTTNTLNSQMQAISAKDNEIDLKKKRQKQQLLEIREKQKLILTRDRMLQITQERNVYKKKIIYTLIAFIIATFVFMLVCYVYFNKKQ